ncbi:MAG: thermonuclease family protein [Planctomyces sp.]|nr:thermonuclease family protein [Planctomyces sp.]
MLAYAHSRMSFLALLLTLGASSFSSRAFTAQQKEDSEEISTDGIWHPVTAVMSGMEMSQEVRDGIVLKLSGQQYSVTVNGTPDKGVCELDLTTKPSRMTIKGTVGPNQGKTMLAIFEFTTPDRLRVCYDVTGQEFPEEFKSEAGTTQYLVEYRRELPRGAELIGKVVELPDSDVLQIQTVEGKEFRIRLNGVDAPELKQSFGETAREQLRKTVGSNPVRVITQGEDRTGQIIGDVYVRVAGTKETDKETHLNSYVVEHGLAWHFVRYAPDNKTLADAQKSAQGQKAGLWAESDPVAPWDWRRQQQDEQKKTTTNSPQ